MGTTTRRGADALANALRIIGMAVVVLLVLHITLTLLDANPENGLVTLLREAADLLDLGLSNLFLESDPEVAVLLNYGAAALIWLLVTAVVVRLVRRIP